MTNRFIESIPKSWASPYLEELALFMLGGDWGKAADYEDDEFVDVACIRGAEFREWNLNKGSTAAHRKIKKTSLMSRQLIENDILVEISGGGPDQPVGRTVLITKTVLSHNPELAKVCTNFLRLYRPSTLLESRYLNFFLLYFYKSGEVVKYQAGSNNLRNLKFNDYLGIQIPFPPLNEQHRIVDKIEELFSEIDKGVESLQTAKAQLQVYRQALLKHAFEGKLTAQWRADNPDKVVPAAQLLSQIQQAREERYQQQLADWKTAVEKWELGGKEGKKPSKPRKLKSYKPLDNAIVDVLPNCSEGWVWGKLGWMTLGVEYGTSAKSSGSGEVPVLRMGNIQNGKFEWDDLVYTSDQAEIEKYTLKPYDVLFNRTNSPELVGKTAIYRGQRPAIFAGYLIRVNQLADFINSDYLNYYLNSYFSKNYGNGVKTDGVNQSNINGDKLSNYPYPYCSIAEQREIVAILDEKLSECDNSLSVISDEIDRAEALRQSILKKAFSGQLVPQDPTDEPTSQLLARIQAEKAEGETNKTVSQKSRRPRKMKTAS